MTARGPAFRPARVALTLKDGCRSVQENDNSKRDAERPDPEPHVRAKFKELAGTMLNAEGVAALEAACDHPEAWPSMATPPSRALYMVCS